MSEQEHDYANDTECTLRAALTELHAQAADVLAEELVDRWASSAKACVHLAVRINAAIERVRGREEWEARVARLASTAAVPCPAVLARSD